MKQARAPSLNQTYLRMDERIYGFSCRQIDVVLSQMWSTQRIINISSPKIMARHVHPLWNINKTRKCTRVHILSGKVTLLSFELLYLRVTRKFFSEKLRGSRNACLIFVYFMKRKSEIKAVIITVRQPDRFSSYLRNLFSYAQHVMFTQFSSKSVESKTVNNPFSFWFNYSYYVGWVEKFSYK